MSFYGYDTFSSIFFLLTQSFRGFGEVTRFGYNLTIMPYVYFGHILHTAVTNLHCVSVQNIMRL